MSMDQLRLLLERAATNDRFRNRLCTDPEGATGEYDLSAEERQALRLLAGRADDFERILQDLFSQDASMILFSAPPPPQGRNESGDPLIAALQERGLLGSLGEREHQEDAPTQPNG